MGVCTRVLGDAVPHYPEALIAKRLLYDDAILRLHGEHAGARDVCIDLP